jgi:mono/diheme cytochrome c family protein
MIEALSRISRTLLLVGGCSSVAFGSTASLAADPGNGEALAKRWCSSCHVVEHDQKLATDQAPPFATIARMPGFGANKLAFLLLKPHPNMPTLSLERREIADLANYIASLK